MEQYIEQCYRFLDQPESDHHRSDDSILAVVTSSLKKRETG